MAPKHKLSTENDSLGVVVVAEKENQLPSNTPKSTSKSSVSLKSVPRTSPIINQQQQHTSRITSRIQEEEDGEEEDEDRERQRRSRSHNVVVVVNRKEAASGGFNDEDERLLNNLAVGQATRRSIARVQPASPVTTTRRHTNNKIQLVNPNLPELVSSEEEEEEDVGATEKATNQVAKKTAQVPLPFDDDQEEEEEEEVRLKGVLYTLLDLYYWVRVGLRVS